MYEKHLLFWVRGMTSKHFLEKSAQKTLFRKKCDKIREGFGKEAGKKHFLGKSVTKIREGFGIALKIIQ
jgi:hypothetical protein